MTAKLPFFEKGKFSIVVKFTLINI